MNPLRNLGRGFDVEPSLAILTHCGPSPAQTKLQRTGATASLAPGRTSPSKRRRAQTHPERLYVATSRRTRNRSSCGEGWSASEALPKPLFTARLQSLPINPRRGKWLSSAVHAVLSSSALLINQHSQARERSCALLPGGPQTAVTAAGGMRAPWLALLSGTLQGQAQPSRTGLCVQMKSLSQRDHSQIGLLSCFVYL